MSEKMNIEFEVWVSAFIGRSWLIKSNDADCEYSDDTTQFMWEAWKASRLFLVVDLPRTPYCAQGMAYPDYSDALRDCRNAMDSAGIKCK